nr:glycosyl hydrolase family 28 protein [uncultured Carboxylicivirga sp.]
MSFNKKVFPKGRSYLFILLIALLTVTNGYGNSLIKNVDGRQNSYSEASELIEIFPVPSCYQTNNQYTLHVKPSSSQEWLTVPLIDHTTRGVLNCTYGNFYFTESVDLKITKTSTIYNHSISPKSYNIESSVVDNVLNLTLASSKYLMVTIDGTDIVVLADKKDIEKPAVSGPAIFNVNAEPYNADNTGTQIVTSIIQQAIDDASNYADGTGIVYIPQGVYNITRLNAKSNIEIYLDGGAVLRGTGNPQDYDEYVAGGEIDYTYCIHAENQSNIKIWGPGTIDGNGINLTGLTSAGTQPSDIDNAIMKIRALSIHNCSNVDVSNVITRECSSWTQSFYDSDNINVHATKVINERVLKHNDGIDFSACQHVRANHCFVLTSDDAVCAKGTDDNHEDCYDIRFEDIVVYSNTRGVKCGMQAYNKMYDIWFNNIDVLNARYGIDLLHQDGTGEWNDIHFRDIRVENLSYFTPSEPRPIVASVEDGGKVTNVEITNCSFDSWGTNNSRFVGHKYGTISNVIFTNLKIGDELMYSAEQANLDKNIFTGNVFFQVGDYENIAFPSLDNIEEEGFVFEPEDYSDQQLFAPFIVREDPDACQGKYIECDVTNSNVGVDGKVEYNFTVKEQAEFIVWLRTIAPNDTDDSFWVIMDGNPHKFNNIEPSESWNWDVVKDSDTGENPVVFNLSPGEHTLEIMRRENGTKLDKVYITNQKIITPNGCLDELFTDVEQLIYESGKDDLIVIQNPVEDCLQLSNTLCFPGILKLYDIRGREIKKLKVTQSGKVNVADLKSGIYFLELSTASGMLSQKIVLK